MISLWWRSMAQASITAAWVRQGEPHTGVRLSTLGSKDKTQAHPVRCSTTQKATIRVSRSRVWCLMREEREREIYWFRSCEQRHVWSCWQEHRWANPKSLSLGDLVPPFICHIVPWAGEINCSSHCPLTPEAGERAGPEVTRAGDLSLAPASCSIWENRPCTFPQQHNRANPGGGGVCEPHLK